MSELPKATPVRTERDEDAQITALRTKLRQHPVHGCADRESHARWAERYERAKKERDALARRIEGRTNTIARRFDRVVDVLVDTQYLERVDGNVEVNDSGRMLMKLYTESDLLAAECVRSGVWNELSPVQLAAVVSTLVFTSRSMDEDEAPRIPGSVQEPLAEMVRIWADIHEREHVHGLDVTKPLDLGFVWPMYRWASGSRLEAVLAGSELTAGDFVRTTKMVIDLLGQLGNLDSPISSIAREAADLISRGVVTYSSLEQ